MNNVPGSASHICIHRPLIPMVVAIALGISFGVWKPGLWLWAASIALLVIMGIIYLILKNTRALWLPLLLCVAVGYLSIQPWLDVKPHDRHVVHFVDSGYWKIQGRLTGKPRIRSGRWQFVLSAERLTRNQNIADVCGLLRVTGRGKWPGARTGDRVTFRGRLRTIRSFKNPGGFDYERYMLLKGIRARVYVAAKSLEIESTAPNIGIFRMAETIQSNLCEKLDTSVGDHQSDTLKVLKTLVLGDRHQIDPALREQFNRAGVGHVLAISGLHVGMVAVVSFTVFKCFLALIPVFLRRAWVGRGAALLSLGSVLGYGILAGLSPSTQRAMLMVSVFLLSLWIGRRHDWLNTLALAALIILVLHPPALMSISFQLSFVAVLAILAGSILWGPQNGDGEAGFWKKTGLKLLSFVKVSAMAILGTLPLVLHYFNQISLVGLVTNLLVVPLVGLVVVPFGLLGVLGIFAAAPMGVLCWHLAALGVDLILWAVRLVDSWPWAAIHSVTPTGIEIMLYYSLGALWLFWKKLPHRKTVLIALIALCFMDAGYWVYKRYGTRDLQVTVLDVGQASANLVQMPGGYTAMVDGGGFSDNTLFDMGARVLAPILWKKKIKTIDLVVLSHANSDHLNGLLYILKHFTVREVWSNHEPASTKGYRQWVDLISQRNIRHVAFQDLDREVIRQGVKLEILSPPADFRSQSPSAKGRHLNDNSLVLRVGFGQVSFLFTGDITARAESSLVARTPCKALDSTVLLVPHHGSRTSTTMELLAAVCPAEAIISAGWQNRFKFPHAQVLGRLELAGVRVWCTANSGAVEIVTDGKKYTVRTFRGPSS